MGVWVKLGVKYVSSADLGQNIVGKFPKVK